MGTVNCIRSLLYLVLFTMVQAGLLRDVARATGQTREPRSSRCVYKFYLPGGQCEEDEQAAQELRNRVDALFTLVTEQQQQITDQQMQIVDLQRQITNQRIQIYGFHKDGGSEAVACTAGLLCNPSFEHNMGWAQYYSGFAYTTEDASVGLRSIVVTGEGNRGARQVITMPSGIRSFQVTAESRCDGCQGANSSRYSMYMDLWMSDGTPDYMHVAQFDVANPRWHERTVISNLDKDISRINIHALYRYFTSGMAFFDNIRIWIKSSEITTDCRLSGDCTEL